MNPLKVKSLLGHIGYFRKFVKGYDKIAYSMEYLIYKKKDTISMET